MVFLEGGPQLAAAFLQAGLVDEVVVYVAPRLLGAGASAVAQLGITTIADAVELLVTDVTTFGTGADANVRITMRPSEVSSRRWRASSTTEAGSGGPESASLTTEGGSGRAESASSTTAEPAEGGS